MCTVTFVATKGKLILTSNRDELPSRSASFELKETLVNGNKLTFPKDPKAGGTWFVIGEKGTVGVLLNGAFKKHIPEGNYAKSRGLVLLDIVSHQTPLFYLEKLDLTNIEPFTLVLFQSNTLTEFRWDGHKKYNKLLEIDKSYIWSSATLYSDEIIKKRAELFTEFLNDTTVINSHTILDFHSDNKGDYENGFIIDRKTGLKTLSVTQAVVENNTIVLNHLNLLENQEHTAKIVSATMPNYQV